MTIIEKEIARRESIISDKAEKENKVIEMQLEIERLTAEILAVDEATLRSEIAELESYLPKPEPMPDAEAESTNCAFIV